MYDYNSNVSYTNKFLRRVFLNMIIGVAISLSVCFYLYNNVSILYKLTNYFTLIAFAQLGMVLALNLSINRISSLTARMMFYIYSALNGLTLSVIGVVYSPAIIFYAFVTAVVVFAVMAIFGLVTNEDLSSYRTFLMIGLISLVVMSLVNIFLKIQAIYWIETLLGVVIFCGLTAFDVNRIKHIAYQYGGGDEEMLSKIGTIGALQLYLDFINMFLYILRIFGRKK